MLRLGTEEEEVEVAEEVVGGNLLVLALGLVGARVEMDPKAEEKFLTARVTGRRRKVRDKSIERLRCERGNMVGKRVS